MGRRKKKKKRRGFIQLTGDPLQEKKLIQMDRGVEESQNQSLPRQGERLNPKSMLQLQQAIGNKQVRRIIGKESHGKVNYPVIQKNAGPGLVQRGTLDGKKRGYKRELPPEPKVKFARPLAPGRRRRKPPAPPEKRGKVQAPNAAPEIKAGSTRLMSAAEFKKITSLKILGIRSFQIGKWRIGRKGKSVEYFDEWTDKLKRYHGQMQGKSLSYKADFLRSFAEQLYTWLDSRGAESSRSKPVETLATQIITEIDRMFLVEMNKSWQQFASFQDKEPKIKAAFLQNILSLVKPRQTYHTAEAPKYAKNMDLSPFKETLEALEAKIDDEIDKQLWQAEEKSEWFTKAGERSSQEGVKSGQMNKLDYVKYRFKLEKEGEDFKRTMVGNNDPSAWQGYFKKKSLLDTEWEDHRGRKTEMPKAMPGHHRRTLAMYKLDQLLGTDVIPPTFLAKHKGKLGTVMESVQGKAVKVDGKRIAEDSDPVAQDAKSKLFMLDLIAGQVDRHSGNYLITMDGGVVKGVKGIDLDLAFGPKLKGKDIKYWNDFMDNALTTNVAPSKGRVAREAAIAGQVPVEFKELNQETAKTVIKFSKNEGQQLIRDCLQGYISDAEIDATLDRLKGLAEILKPILNKMKGVVITGKEK